MAEAHFRDDGPTGVESPTDGDIRDASTTLECNNVSTNIAECAPAKRLLYSYKEGQSPLRNEFHSSTVTTSQLSQFDLQADTSISSYCEECFYCPECSDNSDCQSCLDCESCIDCSECEECNDMENFTHIDSTRTIIDHSTRDSELWRGWNLDPSLRTDGEEAEDPAYDDYLVQPELENVENRATKVSSSSTFSATRQYAQVTSNTTLECYQSANGSIDPGLLVNHTPGATSDWVRGVGQQFDQIPSSNGQEPSSTSDLVNLDFEDVLISQLTVGNLETTAMTSPQSWCRSTTTALLFRTSQQSWSYPAANAETPLVQSSHCPATMGPEARSLPPSGYVSATTGRQESELDSYIYDYASQVPANDLDPAAMHRPVRGPLDRTSFGFGAYGYPVPASNLEPVGPSQQASLAGKAHGYPAPLSNPGPVRHHPAQHSATPYNIPTAATSAPRRRTRTVTVSAVARFCDVCNKGPFNASALAKHKNSIECQKTLGATPVGKYKCPYCPKRFPRQDHIKRHVLKIVRADGSSKPPTCEELRKLDAQGRVAWQWELEKDGTHRLHKESGPCVGGTCKAGTCTVPNHTSRYQMPLNYKKGMQEVYGGRHGQ